VASGFEEKLKKNLLGAFGATPACGGLIIIFNFPHKTGAGCHQLKGNKKN